MAQDNFFQNVKDLPSNLNAKTISAGLLSGIFGMTTSLIIIGAGTEAHLSQQAIISWVFSTFFFGALTGLILSIAYRQPIPGAWSIPGAALVLVGLKTFSIPEMIGAYLIANILVMVIGFSGLMGRVIKMIPLPIVLAMIVGVLMSFGTGMFKAFASSPLISGTAIAVYLLANPIKAKFPPILVAFCAAGAVALMTGQFQLAETPGREFILPTVWTPSFNLNAAISVSIPLALLVICGEMPKAIGVLISQGYAPPVNSMTTYCGLGGIIVSFFGGTNVNIAGPMCAICSAPDCGTFESRYASVLINALIFGIFGVVASIAVPFVVALPPALISTIAGLAMINVLLGSLQSTFIAKKFQTGAFFSLIIAMSGITILGIASPVWALVGGVVVSLFMERQDFQMHEPV